jgi:hypothetical protein
VYEPVTGHFVFKITRSTWSQEANSEIVKVNVKYSSSVVSYRYVNLYYIKLRELLVTAHRKIKYFRKCMPKLPILVHLPKFNLCQCSKWHQIFLWSVNCHLYSILDTWAIRSHNLGSQSGGNTGSSEGFFLCRFVSIQCFHNCVTWIINQVQRRENLVIFIYCIEIWTD